MITLHSQSVNVKRVDLLVALKGSLEDHEAQYLEAIRDYKAAVVIALGEALERAKNDNFKHVKVAVEEPRSYAAQYRDIIDMLEVSVDEIINLDKDSYKAYYRNEWSWSNGFNTVAQGYKSLIAGASGGLGLAAYAS